MHWLWIHAGLSNASGSWYLFWSGIGSILLVGGSILSVPYTTWKHHNCHQARCPRIGRYRAADVLLCRRHHPDPAIREGMTAKKIAERYHLYLGDKPGKG